MTKFGRCYHIICSCNVNSITSNDKTSNLEQNLTVDREDEGHSVLVHVEGPAEGDADTEHLPSAYNEQGVLLALHYVVLLRVMQRPILRHQKVHLLH